MKYVFNKVKNKATHSEMENSVFYDKRIGFWGNVIAVNSVHNTVDVISDIGIKYLEIPVFSREWVVKKDNYVTGSRNLPPVDSRVFILTPTHSINGAFVLCGGYSKGDTDLQTLFAADSDKETKNNINEKVTQSGWVITEEFESGNVLFKSKDEKISLLIEENDDDKQNITFNINDLTITLDPDDNKVININGNTIKAESGDSGKLTINENIEFLGNGKQINIDGNSIVASGSGETSKLTINGHLEVSK